MAVKYEVVWTTDEMADVKKIVYGNRALADGAARHILEMNGHLPGFMIQCDVEGTYERGLLGNDDSAGADGSEDIGTEVISETGTVPDCDALPTDWMGRDESGPV